MTALFLPVVCSCQAQPVEARVRQQPPPPGASRAARAARGGSRAPPAGCLRNPAPGKARRPPPRRLPASQWKVRERPALCLLWVFIIFLFSSKQKTWALKSSPGARATALPRPQRSRAHLLGPALAGPTRRRGASSPAPIRKVGAPPERVRGYRGARRERSLLWRPQSLPPPGAGTPRSREPRRPGGARRGRAWNQGSGLGSGRPWGAEGEGRGKGFSGAFRASPVAGAWVSRAERDECVQGPAGTGAGDAAPGEGERGEARVPGAGVPGAPGGSRRGPGAPNICSRADARNPAAVRPGLSSWSRYPDTSQSLSSGGWEFIPELWTFAGRPWKSPEGALSEICLPNAILNFRFLKRKETDVRNGERGWLVPACYQLTGTVFLYNSHFARFWLRSTSWGYLRTWNIAIVPGSQQSGQQVIFYHC